jgi:hypothetical protein
MIAFRWWLCLIVLLTSGSSHLPQAPREDALAGRWTARFDLEKSDRLPRASAARQIKGEIVFGATPATRPGIPNRAVYSGSYRIPFGKFGFGPDRSDAIGWHTDGTNVRIILNSSVDHGHIELVGEQHGRTIEGNWALIGDPATASGRFTLTLRRVP